MFNKIPVAQNEASSEKTMLSQIRFDRSYAVLFWRDLLKGATLSK